MAENLVAKPCWYKESALKEYEIATILFEGGVHVPRPADIVQISRGVAPYALSANTPNEGELDYFFIPLEYHQCA